MFSYLRVVSFERVSKVLIPILLVANRAGGEDGWAFLMLVSLGKNF